MLRAPFITSRTSIEVRGKKIPGAEDRQKTIAGFDQKIYSQSHVLCIGAGGLISNVAPALVRKGIGKLTIFDPDFVEASNLNRQKFYSGDIGKNKAVALIRNLRPECIYNTELVGYALSIETAICQYLNVECNLVICGIDNNPGRAFSARLFRELSIPVIFLAVSENASHGYVFLQGKSGPCIGCLFPDIGGDERYPCQGGPAVCDILQLVGALAVYAADAVLMNRRSDWNYRSEYLYPAQSSTSRMITVRPGCVHVTSH